MVFAPISADHGIFHALQSVSLRRPAALRCVLAGAARPFLAAIVIQGLAGAGSTAGSVPEGLV
jgi:hypothetical protein